MSLRFAQIAICTVALALLFVARAEEPIDIGSRRELFVDLALAEHVERAELKLHEPVRKISPSSNTVV